MIATLLVLANVVVIVALCVSIVRFWFDDTLGSESRPVRELAAAGTVLTLLMAVMIYSGEFRHSVLSALQTIGGTGGLYNDAKSVLTTVDELSTSAANFINGALGAGRVGYRPYPPAWPAILLVAGYGVRFLIYRLHTRKGNKTAALTGSVYWSHASTYVLVMAYLIVIAGDSPWVVIPSSIVLLAAVVVSIKLIAEDVGVTIRTLAKAAWRELTYLAGRIAYYATEFAAMLRSWLAYANVAYITKVRKPLRTKLDLIEKRNVDVKGESEKRLADQDARLKQRFETTAQPGTTKSTKQGKPREPVAPAAEPNVKAEPAPPRPHRPPPASTPPPAPTSPPRPSVLIHTETSRDGSRVIHVPDHAPAQAPSPASDLSVVAEALWRAVEASPVGLNVRVYDAWRTKASPKAPTGDEIERRFGSMGNLNGLVRRVLETPSASIADLESALRTRERRPPPDIS